MQILKPSVSLEDSPQVIKDQLKKLEKAGRICYKTEDKAKEDSFESFLRKIIDRGHESVIEHMSISFTVRTDRGVTHELVRHRLASYSQESSRYCNYSQDKFGNQINVIAPPFFGGNDDRRCQVVYPIMARSVSTDDLELMNNTGYALTKLDIWFSAIKWAEWHYFQLLEMGAKPEEARSVLPNSLKADIMVTMNPRQWRWFLHERMSNKAHPQMRQVSIAIFEILNTVCPVLVEDYVEQSKEVRAHFVEQYGLDHLINWSVEG